MTGHPFDGSCIDYEPWCESCDKPPIDCTCDECPTCRGSGRVNPLTAPPDFFCIASTDCPHCDGSGTI